MEHFHRLYQLLLDTRVTDERGAIPSVDEGVSKTVEMILSVKSASRKIMVIGNGGSAAVASHMQNDLCKAVGVRALVFSEPPLLTAYSNDHGFECVFERPIGLWAKRGDLLFAISSSGQSENILCAVRASLARECQVVTLSGFSADNPLRRMGHLNFYNSSQSYGEVETIHSVLTHLLTDCAAMPRLEGGESA